VTYRIPIRSAHFTAEEIEEEGFVAYVSKKLAENYGGINDELLCEVEIIAGGIESQ